MKGALETTGAVIHLDDVIEYIALFVISIPAIAVDQCSRIIVIGLVAHVSVVFENNFTPTVHNGHFGIEYRRAWHHELIIDVIAVWSNNIGNELYTNYVGFYISSSGIHAYVSNKDRIGSCFGIGQCQDSIGGIPGAVRKARALPEIGVIRRAIANSTRNMANRQSKGVSGTGRF